MDADVIVLGGGAAGLQCAIEAGRRGRSVLVLEKAGAPGEKIRISGGGRCNFTNLHTAPENFLSDNPHFCRSALARFTPQDFIDRVDRAGIAWHEKKLGQLFCTQRGGAGLILEMLTDACRDTGCVSLVCEAQVDHVRKIPAGYAVDLPGKSLESSAIVVATGGPSIPKMGATGFGYEIARRFGLPVIEPVAALVPLTLAGSSGRQVAQLSGLSLPVTVTCGSRSFSESMLFTHRGLSGPAILQISSYWSPGEALVVDLLPSGSAESLLQDGRLHSPKRGVVGLLEGSLPRRLAQLVAQEMGLDQTLAELPSQEARSLGERLHRWAITPSGTEGFRVAEVTRGGVGTTALSSKTMECREHPGLYFIGEVVDVTGHLGGFNFQWAWASGYAAGQVV